MATDNLRIETFLCDLQSFYNDIEKIVMYYEDTKDVILVETPKYVTRYDHTINVSFDELILHLIYKEYHIFLNFTPRFDITYTITVNITVKIKDMSNDYYHTLLYINDGEYKFKEYENVLKFKKLITYNKDYWRNIVVDGKINNDTFLDFLNHIICVSMSTWYSITYEYFMDLLRVIHDITIKNNDNIVNFEYNYNLITSFLQDYYNMKNKIKFPTIN